VRGSEHSVYTAMLTYPYVRQFNISLFQLPNLLTGMDEI